MSGPVLRPYLAGIRTAGASALFAPIDYLWQDRLSYRWAAMPSGDRSAMS